MSGPQHTKSSCMHRRHASINKPMPKTTAEPLLSNHCQTPSTYRRPEFTPPVHNSGQPTTNPLLTFVDELEADHRNHPHGQDILTATNKEVELGSATRPLTEQTSTGSPVTTSGDPFAAQGVSGRQGTPPRPRSVAGHNSTSASPNLGTGGDEKGKPMLDRRPTHLATGLQD